MARSPRSTQATRRARLLGGAAFTFCAAFGAFIAPAANAAPPRTQTDLACESVGTAPQLQCALTIRAPDGAPVKGAAVTLGASMPTDPNAPAVRPASAAAGMKPGEYRGALALEKAGTWVVMIDIGGPVKDRLARSVKVEACAAGKRCPAPVLPDPAAKR